jgi:VCBS repeat-containing protein
MDLAYDINLVTAAGPVVAGSDYPDFLSGNIGTAGLIDETGAGRTTTLPDGAEYLLVRVPLLAVARGEALFTSNPADVLPAGRVLLFGIDGPVPAENVTYGTTSITVKGPPVAANDNYNVDEDGHLSISASNGVLKNDSDDDNDPLTAVLDQGVAHGTLQFNPNGSFEYTPDDDYFGIDQFTYKANDGAFDSNRATVTINVIGSNDQPVAADDQYSVFRNDVLVVPVASGVIANDFDADGDSLDADLVQYPDNGTVTLNDDGSFTYTPDEDFGGLDQFTYFVHDGTVPSNVATVDINVFFDWQNPTHSVDVNGDGYASPLDALLVYNDLDENGVRTLPNPPVPPDIAPPFFDVNGDGVASSFDARKVMEDLKINGARLLPLPRLDLSLPQPPLGNDPLVRFRVETTDAQGAVSSTFRQGDTLLAKVYVSDLRNGGSGVFSAYLDLLYDQTGLTLDGPLAFGPSFAAVQAG